MQPMNDTERHALFLERLHGSELGRLTGALWLLRRGYTVCIPPQKCAPTRDDWQEYSDHGDLFFPINPEVVEQDPFRRIETKHLSRNFTSRYDWPFGDEFYVCSKGSFDRAERKPYAFMILSHSLTHFAVVLGKDWQKWGTKWTKDRELGTEYEVYLAPLDSVKFWPLADKEEP